LLIFAFKNIAQNLNDATVVLQTPLLCQCAGPPEDFIPASVQRLFPG